MKLIQVPKGKEIVFVGDIHEKEWHLNEMLRRTEVGSKRSLVFVGDILDKGDGLEAGKSITRKLMKLMEDGWAYGVRGNHEERYIKQALRENKKLSKEIHWCKELPLSVSFLFSNQNKITVVHGGVTKHHSWEDLNMNTELMYIRTVDENNIPIPLIWIEKNGKQILVPKDKNGVSWHERYDGRFGFIISSHGSQNQDTPKFYKHSCNIDTKCYRTGVFTGLIVADGNIKDIIQVKT